MSYYLHKSSKLSLTFHKGKIAFNTLETKINLYCISSHLTLNCSNFRYTEQTQMLYRKIIALLPGIYTKYINAKSVILLL